MVTRSTGWLLAGLLVGLPLGWLLGTVAGPGGEAPAAPAEAARRPGDPVPELPAEPRLAGRPLPPAPSSGGGPAPVPVPGPPAPPSVLFHLGDEVWEEDGWLDQISETVVESADVQGWRALLTLYAIAGRIPDFLKGVPPALVAGLSTDAVLELVRLFPAELQVEVIDGLPAPPADQAWNPLILADVFLAAGALDRAEAVIRDALAGQISVDLAQRFVAANPDRAASFLLGQMAEGRLDTETIGGVADALLGQGRAGLAMPFLERRVAEWPTNEWAVLQLWRADHARGLAHAEWLVKTQPENSEVWSLLAQVHEQAGDNAAAFEAWRRAAETNFQSSYLYGMMRADPERALPVALSLAGQATDDEALGSLAKVVIKGGDLGATFEMLVRAHERDPTDHEWLTALVALDPARAAEVFAGSVRTYEGESLDEVIGAYGNALNQIGRRDEAFANYLRAYELDPSDWEWQRGLAAADPRRAIPILEAREREAGRDADLTGALADAYAGAGRSAEAMRLYEEAFSSGGGTEWLAHMASVDPAVAERRLREQLQTSGDAETWGYLGDVLRDQGRTEEARDAYEHARQLNDTSLIWEARFRTLDR